MGQSEFDELLARYLQGQCTPAEERSVLEWYEDLIQGSSLQLSDEERKTIEKKIWLGIQSSTGVTASLEPASFSIARRAWISGRVAVAASIIIILGTGLLWLVRSRTSGQGAKEQTIANQIPDGYLKVSNTGNDSENVRLSDGSLVVLGPKSTLYYPSGFDGKTREVYLSGDGYFQIFHDPRRHFIVHAGWLVTEDLGTSFTIRFDTAKDKIEVSVITGKVGVYKRTAASTISDKFSPDIVILNPNQKVTCDSLKGRFVVSLIENPVPVVVNSNQSAAPPRFIFEDAPLSDVVSELTRVYGIGIHLENKKLENCHFTGDITKQDLYKKLTIICQSTQSYFRVKGTEIFINGQGCN